MRLPLTLAFVALIAGPAHATNTTTFPNNPYYSTGAMSGFRELYVDAEKFVQSLAPVAPLSGGEAQANAELRIVNDTIGWIKVSINGVEVGMLTPMVQGVVHDLKPGQYDVTVEMANKLRTTYRLTTTAAPPPRPPTGG